MYTVITYYDDWEHRPWQEVEECCNEEELGELLDDIGPNQRTPVAVSTEILENGNKLGEDSKEWKDFNQRVKEKELKKQKEEDNRKRAQKRKATIRKNEKDSVKKLKEERLKVRQLKAENLKLKLELKGLRK